MSETWSQQMIRRWVGLKMAHDSVQVAKDLRRQAIVERLIRKTQDGTLGTPTDDWPLGNTDAGGMGVQVGDTIIHQHVSEQHRTAGALGTLGKAALAAALIGTGAALPLAAGALMQSFAARTQTTPAPAPSAPPTADHDTQYQLRLEP